MTGVLRGMSIICWVYLSFNQSKDRYTASRWHHSKQQGSDTRLGSGLGSARSALQRLRSERAWLDQDRWMTTGSWKQGASAKQSTASFTSTDRIDGSIGLGENVERSLFTSALCDLHLCVSK